jgi:hypothetical protein
MIPSISMHLIILSIAFIAPPRNDAKNACWYFLASLYTKLSSLAWCQKYW